MTRIAAIDVGTNAMRCLVVDVGGGSVEVLVMKDGDVVRTESFDMGAVRLLEIVFGVKLALAEE